MDKYRNYAPIVIRIGLSLVFLWFGLNQIFDGSSFLGWLPQWVHSLPIEPLTLILFNGIFETLFGVLLLIGLFTRISALVLGIHLLGIAVSLGYNDVAIRDFGLAAAVFAIFLHGHDKWSLDRKVKNSRLKHNLLIKSLYLFDKNKKMKKKILRLKKI